MHTQSSSTVTLQRPTQPTPSTLPPPGRRLAPCEAERACDIAQVVAAAALSRPQPKPAGACARPRAAAFIRQVAMYLAHVGFGLSMARVGRAFGRDRTTVVHACHVIEDRRDEVRFDALLDHLEQAAVALDAAHRLHRQD
jgi:hypothetical protein